MIVLVESKLRGAPCTLGVRILVRALARAQLVAHWALQTPNTKHLC